MSILCDRTIKNLVEAGTLGISPYREERVQPASYDISLPLSLGGNVKVFSSLGVLASRTSNAISPLDKDSYSFKDGIADSQGKFVLRPGSFCLVSTEEEVSIPDFLACRVEGKSSLGRLGLFIHVTAGYIDPGFKGNITLELYNAGPFPFLISPGMKIGQLSFLKLDKPAEKPYGHKDLNSKYTGQAAQGVQQSLYHGVTDENSAQKEAEFSGN